MEKSRYPYDRLTSDRKWEVLQLFSEGLNYSQISRITNLNFQTVRRYILEWERNRYGVTKEQLETALKNYERWT